MLAKVYEDFTPGRQKREKRLHFKCIERIIQKIGKNIRKIDILERLK